MKAIPKSILIVAILLIAAIGTSLTYSHCQIPCGIYGDDARFSELQEHFTTIEKSMKQIEELSQDPAPNTNQIVRWVNNKEDHADEVSEIITYYFMAQRIKLPPAGDKKAHASYVKKLTLLHELLVYTMKAKQTTDLANIEKLRHTLGDFHAAYTAK